MDDYEADTLASGLGWALVLDAYRSADEQISGSGLPTRLPESSVEIFCKYRQQVSGNACWRNWNQIVYRWALRPPVLVTALITTASPVPLRRFGYLFTLELTGYFPYVMARQCGRCHGDDLIATMVLQQPLPLHENNRYINADKLNV